MNSKFSPEKALHLIKLSLKVQNICGGSFQKHFCALQPESNIGECYVQQHLGEHQACCSGHFTDEETETYKGRAALHLLRRLRALDS